MRVSGFFWRLPALQPSFLKLKTSTPRFSDWLLIPSMVGPRQRQQCSSLMNVNLIIRQQREPSRGKDQHARLQRCPVCLQYSRVIQSVQCTLLHRLLEDNLTRCKMTVGGSWWHLLLILTLPVFSTSTGCSSSKSSKSQITEKIPMKKF